MYSKFQKSIVLPDWKDKQHLDNIGLLSSSQGKIVSFNHADKNSLLAEIHTGELNCVWINLDSDDQDPGRFWLKLVAGLRKFYPEVGKDLISSLIDHHSQPTKPTISKLSQELAQQEIWFVFENTQFLSRHVWWTFVQEWLNQNLQMKWIGIQTDHLDSPGFGKDSLDEVKSDQFENMSMRLMDEQEWLEYLRLLLAKKEFELAGELLENQGETWLENDFDPLEFLFWLREIPSVLLNARPILCWLGAKACHSLELPFLVNYYSNAAENSLSSFSRFTRNENEWLRIEIDEHGVTVGDIFEKIKLLKQ